VPFNLSLLTSAPEPRRANRRFAGLPTGERERRGCYSGQRRPSKIRIPRSRLLSLLTSLFPADAVYLTVKTGEREEAKGLNQRRLCRGRYFSRPPVSTAHASLHARHSLSAARQSLNCATGHARDHFTTTRLLVTENTPGTLLARMLAMFLSASLSTTPSSATWPFFTMMRMGLMVGRAYFCICG
jgi:hypothetical protein